ncbi:helix-hairpin-helix domain-containing protein [Virgibacillus soli]|uniref:Helix-hairpin-helix domain-containing protein n=1 Tax=Paracerasibacillus soli TaxID=480284 RepID=A0ABU5CQK5_9BACI|nr:helix-hairpin-helix domain-containing protein [Virgibacillus soli]MDY0408500.1 helix-hairpin-helix domain-containing protein [Virgibacillus soli]
MIVLDFFKRYAFFILLGFFLIIFLFLTNDKHIQNELTPVVSEATESSLEKDADNTSEEEPQEGISDIVVIDIKGYVKKPGVYEIQADARVHDVIQLAGGFLKEADQSVINLAQKVHDEMVIFVPSEADEAQNITVPAIGNASQQSQKVRINHATKEEIETLNGIGPSKAQAIIDFREENGLFKNVDDLLQVPGIGEKTLENLREQIQIP